MAREMSEEGKAFIKRREALLLVPTWDKIGQVWNVGYGHVYREGEPRVAITREEADALFDIDILYYVDKVNEAVTIDIPQPIADACYSFCYNAGGAAFRGSTFLQYLNDGQFADACVSLLQWRKSAGAYVPGLLLRRAAEAVMFAEGVYL